MSSLFAELIKHKLVIGALAVVGVILVGSIGYYVIESAPPTLTYVPVVEGSVSEDVSGTGSVSPVENPNLSFAVGGRVSQVGVHVGDKVTSGQLLASLDTGILSANLAEANANLSGVTAGPRGVDLAGKQTAVAQAQAALGNTYAALPSVLANAVAQTEDSVHVTDSLFKSFSVADYPRLSFISEDNISADLAGHERQDLATAFDIWDHDVESLSATTSTDTLDAMLATTIARLSSTRPFFDNFSSAVNHATPTLPQTTVSGVSAARASVNGLIISLQTEQQSIITERLAIQSANDALSLLNAGATPEAVLAGQAQVSAASAALSQAQIVAPFSGTIASVGVKVGDVASPNAPALSILPDANFEVQIYLSEIDVAKLSVGNKADVTLDAFGPTKVFPVTVTTIDRASTVVNGVPSYKVTLVFDTQDPLLASGQGANAVIHVGQKDAALVVPSGAVVTMGNQTYVLKKSPQGPVQTPVVVGLVGAETTEIISGLSAGDEIARVAGH